MSNISHGRLPKQKFYHCFQNWNSSKYLLILIPKTIVTCLFSGLFSCGIKEKTASFAASTPSWKLFTWEQICCCTTYRWHTRWNNSLHTSRLSAKKWSSFNIRKVQEIAAIFSYFFNQFAFFLKKKDQIRTTFGKTGLLTGCGKKKKENCAGFGRQIVQ